MCSWFPRFIVLLLLAEILGKVTEDGCSVGRPPFKCCNAARTAPTVASLHTDNDVLVEEAAFLQEANCRFRRELIRSEFANADQIAKPICLFRFRKFEERIQT